MSAKQAPVAVYNKTKGTFLATQVQVADSSLRRLIGLLGKRSLESGSGLLIFPSNSIHTLGMCFSIDVIFLDREFRVHDLCEAVRPFRLVWPRWKARSVLELPVDSIQKSRTELGDELVISADPVVAKAEPQTTAGLAAGFSPRPPGSLSIRLDNSPASVSTFSSSSILAEGIGRSKRPVRG